MKGASARSGSRGTADTKEPRVFKFCFDADRLGSFKRELTLFRLLRDALGDRPDIARLLEVELDEVAVSTSRASTSPAATSATGP